MKLVVVGGSSRNIGKTAVMAGLIRALPRYQWTAIKLTQYGHGLCSEDGQACDCAPEQHPFSIDEEVERGSGTDTSRFLAAGARRAIWARVRMGALEAALPSLRAAIAQDEHVIMESNSILGYWRPQAYVTVLDLSKSDFKDSAREFLPLADAFVMLKVGGLGSGGNETLHRIAEGKPQFPWVFGEPLASELISLVEAKLQSVLVTR